MLAFDSGEYVQSGSIAPRRPFVAAIALGGDRALTGRSVAGAPVGPVSGEDRNLGRPRG